MNDLWEFSMTDFKYRQMDKQGDIPPERNGHTMEFFEGKLYMFGGIHDITWELDDLHIYSLAVRVFLCRKRNGQLWSKIHQERLRKRRLQLIIIRSKKIKNPLRKKISMIQWGQCITIINHLMNLLPIKLIIIRQHTNKMITHLLEK